MTYKRYKMLQKYINGEAQEEYKQGELIDNTTYETLEDCNEGNQNPDKPIEGYIYQWVTVSGEYVCSGVNKYTKQKEQKSSDNGVTWTDTGRTRQGDLIEVNSEDCGYVPPTPGDYENQYLTFEAIDNCTFKSTNTENLFYSLDNGSTWKQHSSRGVSVTAGSRVLWKAEITISSSTYSVKFHRSTGRFNVYGNIMSLIYSDNFIGQTVIPSFVYFKGLFGNDGYGNYANVINAENLILPATTLTEGCYTNMFKGCTSLTSAPELPATTLTEGCYDYMFASCTNLTSAPELPATTLADYCYNGMFIGCRSLTTAPVLPATTLTEGCYQGMFDGCISLLSAPKLPATTLADYCYNGMFIGCRSLTTAPVLPATTLTEGCYQGMFSGCTNLTSAPKLPATTLANNCYNGMFQNCTSLTTAPVLPATTLTEGCYQGMFDGCISLLSAPELPATTLTEYCYGWMFGGCESLTSAPELPATTLAEHCYDTMFYNCTNLNYIKAMFTTTPSKTYTYEWVFNVASSGTFVKNKDATWDVTGTNGIPSGWTVQNV